MQRHPHPTLSLSEGEGFFLIPRPRREKREDNILVTLLSFL